MNDEGSASGKPPLETPATVLVIEDDPEIRELLSFATERENWSLVMAGSAEEGLEFLARGRVDCILLDATLPGIDGFRAIKKIRESENGRLAPIIMATARGEESDIVTALELGADDYAVKPYSPKVLVARVRAALRRAEEVRSGAGEKDAVLRLGDLSLDPERHEAFRGGQALDLSPTEFALLQHFLSNPDIVFTRDRLIAATKGPDYPATDRSVDVQVLGLRRKLAESGTMIETVRGIGYRLRSPS